MIRSGIRMVKINIDGEVFNYKATKNNMYFHILKQRIKENLSYKNIFKHDLTNMFIQDMRDVVNPLKDFEQNSIWGVNGETGCQPKGSKVLMANGLFKNIENIKIGDYVISFDKNLNSRFEKVIRTTKWHSKSNYDVIQLKRHKKKLYSCSFNHLIPMSKCIIPRIEGERKSKNAYWELYNFFPKQLNLYS